MVLKYCEFDMDSDTESENYGQIYKMRLGIRPKDRDTSENIGEIKIGGEREAAAVPEEKIEQWKQDVSLQFGIDAEQLELEILS